MRKGPHARNRSQVLRAQGRQNEAGLQLRHRTARHLLLPRGQLQRRYSRGPEIGMGHHGGRCRGRRNRVELKGKIEYCLALAEKNNALALEW